MIKRIFAFVITAVFIGFLLLAVVDMPEFGGSDNPAHNEVATKYIEDSMADTGAINIVSAMILDYRAFDTFLEASVIFSALICVITTLDKGGDKDGE